MKSLEGKNEQISCIGEVRKLAGHASSSQQKSQTIINDIQYQTQAVSSQISNGKLAIKNSKTFS